MSDLVISKRFFYWISKLAVGLFLALTFVSSAQERGVLSFIDLDPTPPELFEDCLAAAPDLEGLLECTTNTELINVEEFEDCQGQAGCGRFAYSAPMFPDKLGQMLTSTYRELWERNIDDIYDYAYDAWKESGCVIAKFPQVLADVMLYGAGDASLRYWSEVFVASSYYLPASLWWQTPFPGLIDFSGNDSDRIITPIFSLVPNPNQYLELGEQTDRGIYYFQPPAFPSNPVPFEADELVENLPGIPELEQLKESLEPASALEYSQFGHASLFEVYGKRRVVDIFTVWVKECVPSPKTSPLAIFIVPLLPKVETRVTTSAEGYPLSKVGKQSWFPDPFSAYEPNTLEDAADRMMQNPNYTDPGSLNPLDPKGSLLGGFIRTRIPMAMDANIPQEVIDDAKSGGEEGSAGGGFASGGGVSSGGAGGGGAGEEERESLADVLNCPPITVGPKGATPHPILSVEEAKVVRPPEHYNQSIQYLFRDTADHLYSDEVRTQLDEFASYLELPQSSDPASWKLSSSGTKRGSSKSDGRAAGGSFFGASFGGPGSNGVLCIGDEGSEVATLDRLLSRAGHGGGGGAGGNTPNSPTAGGTGGGSGNEFSDDTEQSLKDFQTENGLTPDGMTGPATWAALHATGENRADSPGYQSPTQGAGPGGSWGGGFQGGGGGEDSPNAPSPDDEGATDAGRGHLSLAARVIGASLSRIAPLGVVFAEEQRPTQDGEDQSGEGQDGEQAEGEAPPDSVEIALEVLDNPNILLWDGFPIVLEDGTTLKAEDGSDLVLQDGSDPLSNVITAAEGEPSKRSDFNGLPSGDTWLSPYMLEGLLEIAKYHSIEVIAIAGGVHPPGSRHYEGAAFAISAINGKRVTDMPVTITFGAQPVAPIEGGVLPEGNSVEDSADTTNTDATGEAEEDTQVTLSGAISGEMLTLPESINGEPLDELFKPDEEGGIGAAIKGALDALNPLPLDLATMTLDDLMGSDDISDSFDQDSPNTLLQVIALCELAFATDIYSPLNDERSTIQCNWPTAQEVASGEAEEPGAE